MTQTDSGTQVETKNSNLNSARWTKVDEFYTQWADIEREMNAYLEYDPEVFRDKTVFLPCDDPEWSNFTKFFALHFMEYGLRKLISTSYAPDSNPAAFSYQPTLFEMNDPRFDETKTHANGKKFVLEPKDINDDGVVNIDDLQWEYLEGDGDFRSQEITDLRDESDIIITNPPFSLFRELVQWVADIASLKTYFTSVIDWVSGVFTRPPDKEMRGLEWDRLYETYHPQSYSAAQVDARVSELRRDDFVKNNKGIYEFVLGGEKDTKLLELRLFDDRTKTIGYEKQTQKAKAANVSNCPLCALGNDSNKTRTYKQNEMDADHVTAWSNGGATDISNLTMLCQTHNRAKGNK